MNLRIRNLVFAGALALATINAEPVYLSAKGHTFHKSANCMALSRATQTYTADREIAIKNGLHECSICYRAKKNTAAKDNKSWAQPTQK